MLPKFIVAHQRGKRRAPENSVLFLVDFLEQRALVEFGRPVQIPLQLLLGGVENANLQFVAGLALIQQVPKAAPRSLQLLIFRRVHDLVQLV